MRGMVDVWLRLLVLGSFAHPRMWKVFFPTRGKEPKGARGQPIRASTMAAPRTPRRLVWVRNLLLRKANTFLAGAAWNNFRCHACRPLAAGRLRWAALVARGVVGLSGGGYYVWTDRSGMARFSAAVHGRRSTSNLRRPPQEVAASFP